MSILFNEQFIYGSPDNWISEQLDLHGAAYLIHSFVHLSCRDPSLLLGGIKQVGLHGHMHSMVDLLRHLLIRTCPSG